MKDEILSFRILSRLFSERLQGIWDEREIRSILYLLVEHYLGWPKTLLHTEPEKMIPAREAELLMNALERLSKHEPVQYIIGVAEFRGLRFRVGPGILIPRQETEQLVDLISKDKSLLKEKNLSILDIGTGSGCIAIALKKEIPLASVSACDNSGSALIVAKQNASENGADVEFILNDIMNREHWDDLPGPNLVVSNPPYIRQSERPVIKPNVLEYEPSSALFVPGEDPLIFQRAIAEFAIRKMRRPGSLWLEINEMSGEMMNEMLAGKGFSDVRILQDLHGRDRFARASLI